MQPRKVLRIPLRKIQLVPPTRISGNIAPRPRSHKLPRLRRQIIPPNPKRFPRLLHIRPAKHARVIHPRSIQSRKILVIIKLPVNDRPVMPRASHQSNSFPAIQEVMRILRMQPDRLLPLLRPSRNDSEEKKGEQFRWFADHTNPPCPVAVSTVLVILRPAPFAGAKDLLTPLPNRVPIPGVGFRFSLCSSVSSVVKPLIPQRASFLMLRVGDGPACRSHKQVVILSAHFGHRRASHFSPCANQNSKHQQRMPGLPLRWFGFSTHHTTLQRKSARF